MYSSTFSLLLRLVFIRFVLKLLNSTSCCIIILAIFLKVTLSSSQEAKGKFLLKVKKTKTNVPTESSVGDAVTDNNDDDDDDDDEPQSDTKLPKKVKYSAMLDFDLFSFFFYYYWSLLYFSYQSRLCFFFKKVWTNLHDSISLVTVLGTIIGWKRA